MSQGRFEKESVADTTKICYLFLLSTNIQILRIEDTDLDPYFSDNTIEYISADESIKTGVLAA